MGKFKVNDIVWVKRDTQGDWPAKIKRIPTTLNPFYQVQLFSASQANGLQQTTSNYSENNLLPFASYRCEGRQAPTNVYQVYLIAKKQTANARDKLQNSVSQKDNKNGWTKQDLNNFLQGMLEEKLSEEEIRIGRNNCISYTFKSDIKENKYFYEENLCQIICYLLGERKLDYQTKMCLNETKRKMKAVFFEAFVRGDLFINDSH